MKLFLKGFNHGYTLSKELPDKWLFIQILETIEQNMV